MSVITDLVLFTDFWDRPERNPALWEYIQSYGDGTGDTRLDGRSVLAIIELDDYPTAGGKVFTNDFYAASHNHFNHHKFVDHLRAAPWKEPERWMLVVDYEQDDSLRYYWQDGER